VPNMNGGCLCRDVRYSASGEPVVTSICHCRDCQRHTGSAFVEVVAVPKEAFSIQRGLVSGYRGYEMDWVSRVAATAFLCLVPQLSFFQPIQG
jgi:hypothetical protein